MINFLLSHYFGNLIDWFYRRWADFCFRLFEIDRYAVGYEAVTRLDKKTGERTDFLLIRIKFKLFGFIPCWIPMFDESIAELHKYQQHEDELLKQCLEEDYGEQQAQCTKRF